MPDIPSRVETILEAMLGATVTIEPPQSRVEELLIALKEAIEGGGTTDYTDLENKPSINNVTLVGNKSLSDLGLVNPMIIKGRVNTTLDLPINAEVGWVYFVGLTTDTELKEYVYTADSNWEFVGYNNIVIDSALSTTSENPVQNKVVTAAINAHQTAIDSKRTYTADNTITASSTVSYNLNNLKMLGSYEFLAASSAYIQNLPIGFSDDGRIEVTSMPDNGIQHVLTGSSGYQYSRTMYNAYVVTNLIPDMTSDTAPSGNVIESGHFENRYGWYAFDGTDSHTWSSSAWSDNTNPLDGTTDACYVGYEFVTPQTISAIKIAYSSDRAYTGCVQCKVDGEWVTILDNLSIEIVSGYYSAIEQTLSTPVTCDAIRFCILSGQETYFVSSTYGGNICELYAYGISVTENWTTWHKLTVDDILTPISESAYEALVAKDKPIYFIYDDSVSS